MTLNGAIMQLVELSEHPMMPNLFQPALQKVIETISEIEQPEQQWIPVSSGELPKHNDFVNVTVLDESGDGKFSYTTVGWYLSDGMWIVNNEPMHEDNLIRVIAWMPLPSSYRDEQDGVWQAYRR